MSFDIPSFDILTPRERQVAAALATGATNREIADQLDVSIKTVDTHRSHLIKKLGVRNNAGLACKAIRDGFVSLHDEAP